MTSSLISFVPLSVSAGLAGIRLSYLRKCLQVCIIDSGLCSNVHVAGIAPIAPSEHSLLDAFLFPSPSDSLYLSRHPQSTPDDSLMSFTSSLLTNSCDTTTVRSVNSDDFSSFGSPKFTSTPFPYSPALPACTDHDLAENELLASGITGRHATPHHVKQPDDLQSPVHAASPTRRIKQCDDSTPKRRHRSDGTVEHQGSVRVYRRANPEQPDTIVPPPPRPFIFAGKLPTPVTAKTRPVVNISPEQPNAAIVPPPSRPFILAGKLSTPITAKTRPVINISGAKGSDKRHRVSVLTVGNMRTLMNLFICLAGQ